MSRLTRARQEFYKLQENEELYQRCVAAVDARLSGRRLAHVHSVSECAVELAELYGVNTFDAKLAGLLHDWDKLLTDDEFPARMEELGIEPPDQVELMWPVLHSFTGAKAVQREFPELDAGIISAIWNHTLGAVEMSDLDMVVFVADMIEPLRDAKRSKGIKKLRKLVGEASLGELYFAAYGQTMRSLVDRKRCIHPLALDIWNGLVAKYHPVNKTRQGNADIVL